MNKRGQEGLSINTVIIAIIAIVVLLLVIVFFTGGLGTVGDRIRNVFQGGAGGTERDFAISTCEQRCSQAQALTTDVAKAASAYCKSSFSIDVNGNGRIDDDERRVYCNQAGIGINCPGVLDVAGCEAGRAE